MPHNHAITLTPISHIVGAYFSLDLRSANDYNHDFYINTCRMGRKHGCLSGSVRYSYFSSLSTLAVRYFYGSIINHLSLLSHLYSAVIIVHK